MGDIYAQKTARARASAQRATARETGRLADAHIRQAQALERIASALEALLTEEARR